MKPLETNFSDRPGYRGPLQAVILDWAGTVLDFGSCAPVAAVMEAFRSLDVPITLEQARAPMGKAKREHILAIFQVPEVAERWQSIHSSEIEAGVQSVYDQFLPIQQRVLSNHADLIPGCLETIEHCRQRGMKIGSSTGYTRELMEILVPIAAEQGYRPDAILCAGDVSPGRPAPWMCLENARQLGISPLRSLMKVDDTVVGIEAGLNAGMWTVGVAASGNLVGLTLKDFEALEPEERDHRVADARQELLSAGAHVVVDTIADLPAAMDAIESELATGAYQ